MAALAGVLPAAAAMAQAAEGAVFAPAVDPVLDPVVGAAVAELARDAERSFRGVCLSAEPGRAEVGGVEVAATVYSFRVVESLAGELPAVVTFRQLGRPDGGRADLGELAGLPRYRPGEEYVLLLLPPGRAGLTSPTGAAEGAFRVIDGEAVQILPPHALPRSPAPADPAASTGPGEVAGATGPQGHSASRPAGRRAVQPIALPYEALRRAVAESTRP